MVFGSKKHFARRCKGLISSEEWKQRRLMPLSVVGETNHRGNRHFRMSPDARTVEITILKTSIRVSVPAMVGKWGKILPALAKLAHDREVALQFRIDDQNIYVTFDELDIRRLNPGVTLQAAKDADILMGVRPRRGRPRADWYVPRPVRMDHGPRFVHPEWKDRVTSSPHRAIGIDLNPNWIGVSVIECLSDPMRISATKLLDHQLVHLGIEAGASDEMVKEALAKAISRIIMMARAWNCPLIGVEAGLGHLRSATKSKKLNRSINGWGRSIFKSILARRCRLSGIQMVEVRGAYSTTVGNLSFPIPDACASASEIARRAIALRADIKESLPVFEIGMVSHLWKNEISAATTWVEAHRIVKTTKSRRNGSLGIGYRRPHYDEIHHSPEGRTSGIRLCGYAVERLGLSKNPGFVLKPVGMGESLL
jgi:hypothetical protein